MPEDKSTTSALFKNPSLKAAVYDAMFAAIMVGAGESYISAYGIFLGATTVQIGLLAALPALMGALAQGVGVWCVERFQIRRKLIVPGAAFQACLWLPTAALFLLFGPGTDTVSKLIVLVALYHISANLIAPAWSSLIGELVPVEKRGRYFALRSRLSAVFTFTALILAGGTLQLSKDAGYGWLGFAVIFLAAFLGRSCSTFFLTRYEDPPYTTKPESYFSFWQFIRRSPHSNFARFVFFVATMNMAAAFSAPYFTVYMLSDLKFTYWQFASIGAVTAMVQFLTLGYWGALVDKFGTKKILNVCGWGVSLCPILWLFSAEYYFILGLQIFVGIVWAGFNLAAGNFMYDAVSGPKRARCAAYQAMVTSVFIFIGSMAGGYVAHHLPGPLAPIALGEVRSPLLTVFLISGILRLLTTAFFLPLFQEVREVEPISHRELIFRITALRPIAGATFALFTGRTDPEDD